MKKSQFLIATLCVSAIVLSACTLGKTTKKKKKSSSAEVTSVVPGSNTSGNPTSGIPGGSSVTPGGSSVTPGGSSQPGPAVVSVTGVEIKNKSSVSPKTVGDADFTVTAEVAPSNATNKNVTWVSSDPTVATVSNAGLVHILKDGTTTLTVTTVDGNKTDSVSLTVNPAAPVSKWSAEEQAIFASSLYGYEIPYFEGHHEDMKLQAFTKGVGVSYSGGTSSTALIDEYLALVPAEFKMKKASSSEVYAYIGEIEIQVEGAIKHVQLLVCGLDEENDEISSDGTGTFLVQGYDSYVYEWSAFGDDLDGYASMIAAYAGHDWEADVSIPAFDTDVSYYEVDDNDAYYWSMNRAYGYYYGSVADISVDIYAITENKGTAYLNALEASTDWEWAGTDSYGFDVFTHAQYQLELHAGYFTKGGFFYISVKAASFDAFPSEKVVSYIEEVREDPQEFPIYVNEDVIFYLDEFNGSALVNGYYVGEETFAQKDVDDYADELKAGELFDVEKVFDEDEETGETLETYSWHVTAKDGKYSFYVWYEEYEYSDGSKDYMICWQIQPELEHFSALPGDQVDAFFTAAEISAPETPSMTIVDENGYFTCVADEDGVEIAAYGATLAEIQAYATSLNTAGYTQGELDENGEGSLEVVSDEAHAKVSFADDNEEYGCYVIKFSVQLVDWSEDELKVIADELGGVVLPFLPGGIDLDYYEYSGQVWSTDVFTQAQFDAYVAKATSSEYGFVETTEGTTKVYTKDVSKGTAYFYLTSSGYIYFGFQANGWTEAEEAAFKAALHDVVPPYLGKLFGGESTHAFEGYSLYTADDLAQFDTILTSADGWTKVGSGVDAYYKKDSADGAGYVKVAFEYYDDGDGNEGYFWVIDFVENSTPVPPTPTGDPVTVAKTVTELVSAFGWETGEVYKSWNLDSVISVTASEGTYNGRYWAHSSGDQYRLFESENGTITFAAPAGYVITSITLTYKYENKGILTYNEETVASGTAVEINAQSATFTVSHSDGTDKGKVFITNFSVTYAPAGE